MTAMRMTPPVALAALLASAISAQAQQAVDESGFARFRPTSYEIDARYSVAYKTCMHGSGGVTVSMRACASREYRQLDWDLNFAYGAALTRVKTPQEKETLRRFQRGWLSWRETHCAAEGATVGGGTASLIVSDSCHLAQIIRRTLWLERYGR